MKLPSIVTVPDPALRQQLELVETFDANLTKLADTMLAVMRKAEGVGLAANQIGRTERLFVYAIDEPFETDGQRVSAVPAQVVVNPAVMLLGDVEEIDEEGCLSIPKLYGPVARAKHIKLEARDIHGKPFVKELSGYEARVVQHETDHLNGILFLDRLTDPSKLRRA